MPRLKLTLAYVGTDFHGWQTQIRKDKIVPTIQSLLEEQISRITGAPVHVHGAGRTDAGVHAEAQVAHVDIPESQKSLDWQLALNTSLPPSIRIVSVDAVPDTFHAQHNAKRKFYDYRLWLSRRYTPPWLYPFVWSCGPLQIPLMDEAAKYLTGTKDFASFRNSGSDVPNTVRTLFSLQRYPQGELPVSVLDGQAVLLWRFEANGFLKQMVRNCMGLLVWVGQGKLNPKEIPTIIETKDRRKAPLTAPAKGLTLKKIIYDSES